MKIYQTYSSKETKKFAEALACLLVGREPNSRIVAFLATITKRQHPKKLFSSFFPRGVARTRALTTALSGELGSGKTTFVQGFLRGLGLRRRSPSPTFIIMRRFRISKFGFRALYHIDAYRIKNPRELLVLGIREIFSNPENIVLVEWADRIKRILPKSTINIKFSHGGTERERTITIRQGPQFA